VHVWTDFSVLLQMFNVHLKSIFCKAISYFYRDSVWWSTICIIHGYTSDCVWQKIWRMEERAYAAAIPLPPSPDLKASKVSSASNSLRQVLHGSQ